MHRLNTYLKDDNFKLKIYNNHLYIDNYINIDTLNDNKIALKCSKFIIVIEGTDFVIKKLIDKEILLTGEISNIKFIKQ